MNDVNDSAAMPPAITVDALLYARGRDGMVAVFDFDGTLAPIASAPSLAMLAPDTTRALARLVHRPDTTVGVVSGRSLADLAPRVPVPGLWLFGLHGWEHRPPDAAPVRSWSARTRAVACAQMTDLVRSLGPGEGETIEDKGPIIAVHTRNASPERRRIVEAVVRASRRPELMVVAGRRVLELRPAHGPTKGTAVRAIAAARPLAPILYVGDDTTDEDAFAALGPDDFAVVVDDPTARVERPQGSRTRARFSVAGTSGVARVLRALARAASCPS